MNCDDPPPIVVVPILAVNVDDPDDVVNDVLKNPPNDLE